MLVESSHNIPRQVMIIGSPVRSDTPPASSRGLEGGASPALPWPSDVCDFPLVPSRVVTGLV